MKWNESGFRPPLCIYRLIWARRTSWGWWDDWDDTALQTQDSKFEPWRSEAEHATSWSRRLPTILTFTHGLERNIFVSFKPPSPGIEPRTLAWKAAVLTTTLGPPPNNAARLVRKSKKYDHITPVLKDMHWLPVKSRIYFQSSLHCPFSHAQWRVPIIYISPRALRSDTDAMLLSVPSAHQCLAPLDFFIGIFTHLKLRLVFLRVYHTTP